MNIFCELDRYMISLYPGITSGLGAVSMIALGGPKLKHLRSGSISRAELGFNDSTGWA